MCMCLLQNYKPLSIEIWRTLMKWMINYDVAMMIFLFLIKPQYRLYASINLAIIGSEYGILPVQRQAIV